MTISVIKADLGAIGGHIKPSRALLDAVENHIKSKSKGLAIDWRVTFTGDDIAILLTHNKGIENEKIHRLCWDAFIAGMKVAQEQGLYGAGQDLLKLEFNGTVKGLGPAVAEMNLITRPDRFYCTTNRPLHLRLSVLLHPFRPCDGAKSLYIFSVIDIPVDAK